MLGSALREADRPEEALAIHRALLGGSTGDIPGLNAYVPAITQAETAHDLLALRRWPEAVETFRAVAIPATHTDVDRHQAKVLAGLATAMEQVGELTEAHQHHARAHRLFTATGDTKSAAAAAASVARTRSDGASGHSRSTGTR